MHELIKLATIRLKECCSPVARMPRGMREEAFLILKELKENPDSVNPVKIKRLEILISYKVLSFKINELNQIKS